jgi:hypothetical protein
MKKKLQLLLILFFSLSNAQVGIHTSNPQGVFNVDAAKDNPSSGVPSAAQQLNDFTITASGNVGIGTTTPTTKLDINNGNINGALKIVDGTQGEGRVLTSDANGIGTWRNSTVTNVNGVTPSINTPYGTSSDKYMNAFIDLPQGKWFVFLGFLVNGASGANSRYASRFTLSSSTTAIQEVGFTFINNNKFVLTQISNGPAGAGGFGMFSSGIIRVDVTANSQRLYVWDANSRGFGNTASTSLNDNGENYIFAIKAN